MTPEPLRAGQDRVVVDDHRCRGRRVTEQTSVDGTDTSDDAIRSRALDQVLGRMSGLLCGDGKGPELDEGSRVYEVVEVCTGRATSPAAPTLHGRRSAIVFQAGLEAELAGGQIAHYLFGTATDRIHPDFAIDPFDRIASQIRRPAEDLSCFPCAELHSQAGLHLALG